MSSINPAIITNIITHQLRSLGNPWQTILGELGVSATHSTHLYFSIQAETGTEKRGDEDTHRISSPRLSPTVLRPLKESVETWKMKGKLVSKHLHVTIDYVCPNPYILPIYTVVHVF